MYKMLYIHSICRWVADLWHNLNVDGEHESQKKWEERSKLTESIFFLLIYIF